MRDVWSVLLSQDSFEGNLNKIKNNGLEDSYAAGKIPATIQ